MSKINIDAGSKDLIGMAINDYEKSGVDAENAFFTGQKNEPSIMGEANSPMRDEFMKYAEELFCELPSWFDDAAKKRGLPGLGSINPDKYGKVSFLILKKRIPESWLENSPEMLFAVMTMNIAVNNAVALKRIRNSQDKEND